MGFLNFFNKSLQNESFGILIPIVLEKVFKFFTFSKIIVVGVF